ncbi:CLIP domain-containing serine protease B10-like [Malaya genurostris]|uniref:CLIP domain-containing serine protease B10-like n=1 Tax=Malaya genurostris TaxID=325434 RepID=UPI0026F3F599|nr:CLIP domain-containing serine protease B10-like [Malaya genurostris]
MYNNKKMGKCGIKVILLMLLMVMHGSWVWCQNACRTPNRRDGRCVPRDECRSFVQYFSPDRILTVDELTFVRLSSCSESPPKICCPDRVSTGTTSVVTSTVATPSGVSYDFTGLLPDPRQYECGLDFLADRIYGGESTSLEEFPWYALLEYVTKKGERVFECGGSLINKRYVLTAAHCLDNVKLDDGEIFANVRLGEHNTATDVDCEEDDGEVTCSDPPQNIGFEEVIVHPRYSKVDQNQHHDIALVRLDRDATLSKYVTPICLPEAGFSPTKAGQNVTITGFGHTGRKRHSGIKQKAHVPIVDPDQCQAKWGKRITVGDGQLCAGGHFNIDACHGDSGGPLMTQRLYWTIEGIVSFGNRCGLEGWAGMYTRVASYVGWIKSVIRA